MNNENTFLQEISRVFLYLTKPLGFTETVLEKKTSYDYVVYYMLNAIIVEIYIQPRGSEFEVGVNFGQQANGGVDEWYSFHTYLALVNAPLYYKFGYSIAKSHGDVTQLLEMYADALIKHGQNMFNDSDDAFKHIRDAMRTGKGLCPPYYMQPENNKITSKFI